MRVLITGANGFLAANIVRELNRRKIPVKGLVRPKADLRSLEGADLELTYGTFENPDDMAAAIQGCDHVIHAAAFTGPVPTSLNAYLKPNVEGTRTVIEACIRERVQRLIFVSTANTVGYGTLVNPGREDWPVDRPPFSRLGYARSKMMAEDLIKEAVHKRELNAVIVNPTFIIGPYDVKPSTNRILIIYYRGAFALLPPGGKSFVHSRDVAVAICNALELGRPGERYLLSGQNMTLLEFMDKVEAITGIRQRRLMLPGLLVRLAGHLGGILNLFGTGYPLDPVTAHVLCIRNYYSNDKAVKELKMPQTPIETAIREAWEYTRMTGLLWKSKKRKIVEGEGKG